MDLPRLKEVVLVGIEVQGVFDIEARLTGLPFLHSPWSSRTLSAQIGEQRGDYPECLGALPRVLEQERIELTEH